MQENFDSALPPEHHEPLPDHGHYHYAGQRAANAILPPNAILEAALARAREKGSLHPVITLGDKRYMIASVPHGTPAEALGEHYLMPYYEREMHSYLRQEKRMLSSRVHRFFDNAEPGINVEHSKEELRAMFEHYRQTGEGGPALVGGIMNRLNKVGSKIIRNRESGVDSTDLVGEFRYYYLFLIAGEPTAQSQSKWSFLPPEMPVPAIDHTELIATVKLADGSPDRDGLLFYFAHETGKVLAVETSSQYATSSDELHRELRKNLEMRNREAVTNNVALACRAIDHVHDGLRHMLVEQPTFQSALKQASATTVEANGLNSMGYGYLLDDLTHKARARATVRLKDSVYFKTIDDEFNAAADALRRMNAHLRDQPRCTADMRDALALADQGIDLIWNMAQLRMPRDHNAPAFTGSAQMGSEQSSVGRLETALDQWVKRPRTTGRNLAFS